MRRYLNHRKIIDVFSIKFFKCILYVGRIFVSPYVSIRLKAGLSNRLCTLVSTSIMCRERNKELRISWIINDSCGADFSDLFENNIVCAPKNALIDFDSHTSYRFDFGTTKKTLFYSDIFFHKFDSMITQGNGGYFINFMDGISESAKELFHIELNRLKIRSDILEKMMYIPPGTIGVHIRRTDFGNRCSPAVFGNIKKKMRDLIEMDQDIKFFLSTDSCGVRDELRGEFHDKILCYDFDLEDDGYHKKSRQRIHVLGMQNALLDLYTLSRTTRIIGTLGSSFSWIASMWGDIPLECPRS